MYNLYDDGMVHWGIGMEPFGRMRKELAGKTEEWHKSYKKLRFYCCVVFSSHLLSVSCLSACWATNAHNRILSSFCFFSVRVAFYIHSSLR